MSQASTDEQIEDLRSRALADLESAPDLKSLDEWRVSFMGRRGELTQLLRGLRLSAGRGAPDSWGCRQCAQTDAAGCDVGA